MIPNTGHCLICGKKTELTVREIFDTRFGIEGSYDISQCPLCGLEQLFPLPQNEELVKLYQDHYNFIDAPNGGYKRIRQRFLSSILYDLWTRFDGDITFHDIKGKGRLLDVGCNEGRGLEIYKKNGFDVEGLEINSVAALVAQAKGFKVHVESLDNLKTAKPYDVLVLTNVLEHSLAPGDMVKKINHLLSPGGQLWISCPNSRSWYRTLFGKYWINWHPPFHISHFSQRSLTNILTGGGFEICSIKNESPSLWIAQSMIARLFASRGKVTKQLRNTWLVGVMMLLIRLIFFPVLWFENHRGRGDCLVVVAKKG